MSKRLKDATNCLVALLSNLPSDTVRRVIPGAPTSGDLADTATSLAFGVSALTLDSLGAGGAVSAVVLDQRGTPLANQSGVTYESSDPAVFTVDPATGQITARAQGSATLIARLGSVRPGLSTVTVRQVPSSVNLDKHSTTVTFAGGANRVASAVQVSPKTTTINTATQGSSTQAATVTIAPKTYSLALTP